MQSTIESNNNSFSVWNNYLKSIIKLYQYLFTNGKIKTASNLFKRSKSIVNDEDCPKIIKAEFFAYYGKLLVYTIFFLSNPIDKALKQLNKAEKYLNNENQEILSMILDQKGLAHYYYNLNKKNPDYKEAKELITKSLNIRKKINSNQLISESLFHLGLINEREEDNKTAEENYRLSYDLAKKSGSKLEQSYPIRHIGFLHSQKSDYEEALKCLTESKKLREEVGFKIGLGFSYISLGEAYQALERYEEALENYEKGYISAREVSNNRGVMLSKLRLGILYKSLNKTNLSVIAFKEAKLHAINLNHEVALEMIEKELAELADD